jgi:hypothetical protein
LKNNVVEMEGNLARAVGALNVFVEPLSDAVESLNELAERLPAAAQSASPRR